jgi:hypothetical protein
MLNPDKSTKSLRICEKCDLQMTLLGSLPAIALRAAVRVFRCYACNNVVWEET